MDCCSKEGCKYPIVNKKYKLCKIHNWERINEGKDFFEHQKEKQAAYTKKMQERALEKAKKAGPKIHKVRIKRQSTSISPVSEKMAKQLVVYAEKKKHYVNEHSQCEAHFCNCNTPKDQLTIHHKMGRVGFASEAKRALNIPLLLDEDYFLAVCIKAHRWIEDNVAQSKEWGYSLDRNAKSTEDTVDA